jgi:trehalose 6-phosphate synthase/phosphatase
MAQKFAAEGAHFAQSPPPLSPDRQESVHPGLRPSLVNVPVTPGIHLGEYEKNSSKPSTTSYFAHDLSKLREGMAQSPTEAASGAKSNRDILRRMSLTGGIKRRETLTNVDPLAANPSLSLSGGVISTTFCIPHSLQLRKGAAWVIEPTITWLTYLTMF